MDKLDSWTIDQDGLSYRVDLYPDDDSNADPAGQGDPEVYDAGMIDAHGRGEWEFIGVVVTPVIGGQEIGAAQDSLWSVEYGYYAGWKSPHLPTGVIDRAQLERYPIPSMISEVRGRLAGTVPALVAALQGVSLEDCGAYNPDESRVAGMLVANAYCLRAAGHATPHRDLDGREWATS